MNFLAKLRGRQRPEYPFSGLEAWERSTDPARAPWMATGMGRSGTHFLATVMAQHTGVQSFHLDEVGNPVADSFQQYAKWYGLPVDQQPLIDARAYLIDAAHRAGNRYFESNPYLTLHLSDLHAALGMRCIVLFRDPLKVVESHFNKGWYSHVPPDTLSSGLVPGYDYALQNPNHFFGRFCPLDDEAREEWMQLTRVGKLAWMWHTVYTAILRQARELPDDAVVFARTESLDFSKFAQLAEIMGVAPIGEEAFETLREARPGRSTIRLKPEWNEQERAELEHYTAPLLAQLTERAQ